MRPTFSYWNSADLTKIAAFCSAWAPVLPNHRVLNDADVSFLIQRHFPECPEYVETYLRLSIPSPKSDIARHLALYESGGFYLDVHFGYSDPIKATAFLAHTNQYDLTLVNVALSLQPRPKEYIRIIAGLIGCAKGHPMMLEAASCALQNLTDKRIREQLVGFEPYNITQLTGPALLNKVFFDNPYSPASTHQARLKLKAGNAAIFNELEIPLIRNIFKASYSHPGTHWTERQQHELLFQNLSSCIC